MITTSLTVTVITREGDDPCDPGDIERFTFATARSADHFESLVHTHTGYRVIRTCTDAYETVDEALKKRGNSEVVHKIRAASHPQQYAEYLRLKEMFER